MRNDATEAALGLLGLNSFDPHSTIPLKRKQSSSSLSFYPAPISASSSSQQTTASESIGSGSDSINCICGFTYDDGFSIGCDSCSRWCHAACFDIVETEVPEEWRCWVCDPRPVDRERAVRIQRARQRAAVAQDDRTRRVRRVSATALDGGGSAAAKRKRRASISAQQAAEDEHIDIDEPWTLSYVPITKDLVPHPETRDRLRRVATYWRGVTALSPSSPTPDPASPAVLTPDSLPSPSPISLHPLPKSVHANPAIFSHTNPSVRPPSYAVHATHPILSSQFITPYRSTVIPSTAYLSDPLNAYAHLGMPKPFVHLFGPPLDVALDARIAGDQARFVRNGCRPNAVLRPVLCSRDKRSKARNHSKHDEDEDGAVTFGIFALRDLKAHEEVVLGWEWDDGSVIHHLPALIESPHMFPPHQLRFIRHQMSSMLHALASTFTTCACGASARDCALTRMAQFVERETPPTPAPSPPSASTYDKDDEEPEHARTQIGSRKPVSAGKRKSVDLGPLVGVERGFRTRERVPMSGGMNGVEMVPSSSKSVWAAIDSEANSSAAPAERDARSSRTRSGSTTGKRTTHAQRIVSEPVSAGQAGSSRSTKVKGKATADDSDDSADTSDRPRRAGTRRHVTIACSRASSPSGSETEEKLPPKMRKRWIHKSFEALRDAYAGSADPTTPKKPPDADFLDTKRSRSRDSAKGEGGKMDVDESAAFDAREMPPPPVPPLRSIPSLSFTGSPSPSQSHSSDGPISPSVPFSNLSLLSPIVSGHSQSFSPTLSSSDASSPRQRTGSAEAWPVGRKLDLSVRSAKESPSPKLATCAPLSSSRHGNLQDCPDPSLSPVSTAPGLPTVPESKRADAGLLSESMVVDDDNSATSQTNAAVNEAPEVKDGDGDTAMSSPLPTSSPLPSSLPERPVSPPRQPTPPHELTPLRVPTPPRESSPPHPPPPPPKVKLSFKDFAMRKKKQREESVKSTEATSPTMPSTPVTPLEPPVSHDAPHPIAPDSIHIRPDPALTAVSVVVVDTPPPRSISPADRKQQTFSQAPYRVHPSSDVENEPQRPVSPPSSPLPSLRCSPDDEHISAQESLQAKMELIEPHLPIGTISSPDASELPPSDKPDHHDRTAYTSPSFRPEEGEILSPPPQKLPPLAPRSHSPPTRPRSFYPDRTPPSEPHPAAPVRRPLHPAPFRAHMQNTAPPPRPLPSGPRALRAPWPARPYPPHNQRDARPAPRGPMVDRDRQDWDRERHWMAPSRGRGRGAMSGRGR